MWEHGAFRRACELLEAADASESARRTIARLAASALSAKLREKVARKLTELDAADDAQYEREEGRYDAEL